MTENISLKKLILLGQKHLITLLNKASNKKDENWRFTDLSSIKKGSFRISEKKDAPNADYNISGHELDSLKTVVFYNGHFQESLSTLPKRLRVISNQSTWNKMTGPYHSQPNPHLIF